MTLPAEMEGDGQLDWGEDGCDSLDDTWLEISHSFSLNIVSGSEN